MCKPEIYLFSSFPGFPILFDVSTVDVKAYVGLLPGLTANRAPLLFLTPFPTFCLRKRDQASYVLMLTLVRFIWSGCQKY